MIRRGFTVVELIIVITIMGILLVLGIVNLNNSQVNARDAERKSDIETIASALESVYNSGYTDKDGNARIGQYPSMVDLVDHPTQILKDIDQNALKAPGQSNINLVRLLAGVFDPSSIDINQYMYAPLNRNGSPCTDNSTDGECVKFNLYCKLETSIIVNGTSTNVYQVTSRHQ